MSEFEINAEWLEADEIQGVELAATWCSLTIEIDGEPATRVLSRRSRTVRDNVLVSAYPLAEWIATSWWHLFEERENPVRLRQRAFQETHFLLHARDGYALPNLQIVCLGETCKLDWRAGRLDPYGVEFLSSGSTHVKTDTVRFVFSDFLNQVVSRLIECGVEGTLLQEEWTALNALDSEEREFCKALAAVGLDPFAVSEEVAYDVVEAHQLLTPNLVEELSAVVEGASIRRVAEDVRDLLLALQQSNSKLRGVLALKERISAHGAFAEHASMSPWKLGYSDARALRAELGLNGQAIGSIKRLVQLLDESDQVLTDLTLTSELERWPSMVNGFMATDDEGVLAVGLAASRKESVLFHFSRAIGTYLYHRAPANALTKATSDEQSRSRAFAAELLVPSYALREKISEEIVDEEHVEDIAAEYGVSPYLVHHQLHNHHIAKTTFNIDNSMPDV